MKEGLLTLTPSNLWLGHYDFFQKIRFTIINCLNWCFNLFVDLSIFHVSLGSYRWMVFGNLMPYFLCFFLLYQSYIIISQPVFSYTTEPPHFPPVLLLITSLHLLGGLPLLLLSVPVFCFKVPILTSFLLTSSLVKLSFFHQSFNPVWHQMSNQWW